MSTIVSSVGTGMAGATGLSTQSHLVYAPNQGAWYLLYLSGTQGLSAVYTTGSFAVWTTPASGSPFTLANAHASTGSNFGFAIANLASDDILHMVSAYESDGSTWHARFSLSATGVSNTNSEATVGTASGAGSSSSAGPTTALDSSNYVWDASSYYHYNHAVGATFNVATSTHADSGTSWTSGFGAPSLGSQAAYIGESLSSAMISLGSGDMMAITDNSVIDGTQFTQLYTVVWNGSSWGSTATVFGSAITATNPNNWGVVARSTSDIHVVALSDNSKSFVHYRWNGSSWSAGDTVGQITVATNASVFLATDGTSVWAFTIDSSYNVASCQWVSGTGWTPWATVVSNAHAASYVGGYPSVVAGNIGLIWTVANGSNYDIDGTLFSTTVSNAMPSGAPACSQP